MRYASGKTDISGSIADTIASSMIGGEVHSYPFSAEACP